MTFQDWAKIAIEPSPEALETQVECFYEEHQEYQDAKDGLERLDALADMRQVLACIHAADPLFYPDDFEQMFDGCMNDFLNRGGDRDDYLHYAQAVIKSNFSKFCTNEKDAHDSLVNWSMQGLFTICVKTGDYFVFKAGADATIDGKFYPKGKILKGINYQHPEAFL